MLQQPTPESSSGPFQICLHLHVWTTEELWFDKSLSRPKDKLEWPNTAWWYLSSNAALSISRKSGVSKYCYLWCWSTAAAAPAWWLSQHSSPKHPRWPAPSGFVLHLQAVGDTNCCKGKQILCVSISILVTAQLKCCWNLKTNKKLGLILLFFFFLSWTDLNRTRGSEVSSCHRVLPIIFKHNSTKDSIFTPSVQSQYDTWVKPPLWSPRVYLASTENLSLSSLLSSPPYLSKACNLIFSLLQREERFKESRGTRAKIIFPLGALF